MPIRHPAQQEYPELSPLWSMSSGKPTPGPISTLTLNDDVPENLFGKDHWSTFAYVETQLVDMRGYTIACDARMRTDMHNRRIFEHRPRRLRQRNRFANAMLGNHSNNGSMLRDGTVIPHHDDWCCLQDLAKAGYLVGDALRYPLRGIRIKRGTPKETRAELEDFMRQQMDPTGIDVGAKIKFTPRGFQVAAALREHKAKGGTFATFVPPRELPGEVKGEKMVSGQLPVEVLLRAVVVSDQVRDVYTIGGAAVDGPQTEIEVVNMRGAVLLRLAVGDIAGWLGHNHYRYVPGTRGSYHREPVAV